MRIRATDNLVEEIISNVGGEEPDARKRHVFRQILYSLVRLAQAEQLQDMRHDVALATGKAAGSSRHQARAVLREIGRDADPSGAGLPCPGPGCPDGRPNQ